MKWTLLLILLSSGFAISYDDCFPLVGPISFDQTKGIYTPGIKDIAHTKLYLSKYTSWSPKKVKIGEILDGNYQLYIPLKIDGRDSFVHLSYALSIKKEREVNLKSVQFTDDNGDLLKVNDYPELVKLKKTLMNYKDKVTHRQMLQFNIYDQNLYFILKFDHPSMKAFENYEERFYAEFGQNRKRKTRYQENKRKFEEPKDQVKSEWKIKTKNMFDYFFHDRIPKGIGTSPVNTVGAFLTGAAGTYYIYHKRRQKKYAITNFVILFNDDGEELHLLVLEEKNPSYNPYDDESPPHLFTLYYPDDGKLKPIINNKINLYQYIETTNKKGERVEEKISREFTVSTIDSDKVYKEFNTTRVFELKKVSSD